MKNKTKTIFQYTLLVGIVLLIGVAIYYGIQIKNKFQPDLYGDKTVGGKAGLEFTYQPGQPQPFIGNPDAPLTLTEYYDLQCLYCRKFYQETYTQIKENYIDTGKIKYELRDYPLTTLHPDSMNGALATDCAREQGDDETYFAMNDKIFDGQRATPDGDLAEIPLTLLVSYATELGLNPERFETCIKDQWFKPEIELDVIDASKHYVTATPGFTINGAKFTGARDFDYFREILDQKLQSLLE